MRLRRFGGALAGLVLALGTVSPALAEGEQPAARILAPVTPGGVQAAGIPPMALLSVGSMLLAAGLAALLVRPARPAPGPVKRRSRGPRHGTRRRPASGAPRSRPGADPPGPPGN